MTGEGSSAGAAGTTLHAVSTSAGDRGQHSYTSRGQTGLHVPIHLQLRANSSIILHNIQSLKPHCGHFNLSPQVRTVLHGNMEVDMSSGRRPDLAQSRGLCSTLCRIIMPKAWKLQTWRLRRPGTSTHCILPLLVLILYGDRHADCSAE